MKATAALIAVNLVVAACTSDTASSPRPTATPSATTQSVLVASSQCRASDIDQRCLPPVDASIEPISLSNPSQEAAAVLERCLVGRTDIQVVAGGLIPHARDGWEYVPVPRYQLNFQSDESMWLLQLRGTFTFPTQSGAAPGAGTWRDPVCFVRDGDSGYIDVSDGDRSAVTKSLPPPAPWH